MSILSLMVINRSTRPYSGYIDPSFPNPHGPDDARIIIYGYRPSTALCILSLTLFSIATLVHTARLLRSRLYSTIGLSIAGIMEIIGYAFRYQSAHVDPYRITFFVVQYFFIVVAPVFISAALYVCLSKLVTWARGLEQNVKLPPPLQRPRVILWVFIAADAISTVVQVLGAALIGHAMAQRKDPSTPNHILLAGLAFQSAAFLVYLVLLGMLTRAASKAGVWTCLPQSTENGQQTRHMLPFVWVLWGSSGLIFLRTIYRLAETAQGVFGFVRTHEVFFGVLEFAPVVLAMTLLAIWHPGMFLGHLGGIRSGREVGDRKRDGSV